MVSSGPSRRSQRAKSNKPRYRVDNASENANSQDKGVEASHALGLEDYKVSEFKKWEPNISSLGRNDKNTMGEYCRNV